MGASRSDDRKVLPSGADGYIAAETPNIHIRTSGEVSPNCEDARRIGSAAATLKSVR